MKFNYNNTEKTRNKQAFLRWYRISWHDLELWLSQNEDEEDEKISKADTLFDVGMACINFLDDFDLGTADGLSYILSYIHTLLSSFSIRMDVTDGILCA